MSCSDIPDECESSKGLSCQGPVGSKKCLSVDSLDFILHCGFLCLNYEFRCPTGKFYDTSDPLFSQCSKINFS